MPAPEGYDNQVEQLLTDLVTEPEQILETGRLFDDPLDVFDETDLIQPNMLISLLLVGTDNKLF